MSLLTVAITGISSINANALADTLGYLIEGMGAKLVTVTPVMAMLSYDYDPELLRGNPKDVENIEELNTLHEFVHEVSCLPMMFGVQVNMHRKDDTPHTA